MSVDNETNETDELAELTCDPCTGEVIDPTNADHLIAAWERLKMRIEQLEAYKALYTMAIDGLTRHEAKTERVCGATRQVVVEHPGVDFDQATLKRLWEMKPELAKQYLRIERVGVQAREYDKLHRMSGPPDLEAFRRELMSAEKPSNRRPSIRIEK